MSTVKGPGPRPTRKEKAAATRLRMVESALAAFVDKGYGATTMDAIARDAGVAVQTVYFTFRTKGDLLQAAYEHVVHGPDDLPPHETAWWRTATGTPDIRVAVRALVEGTVELLERAAPLVWTVLGDPTAREGYEYNEGLRRTGTGHLVAMLSEKHPLRDGLTAEQARDVMLVLTGPLLHTQLTRDMGWSREAVTGWVSAAVLRELFALEP